MTITSSDRPDPSIASATTRYFAPETGRTNVTAAPSPSTVGTSSMSSASAEAPSTTLKLQSHCGKEATSAAGLIAA